MPIIGPLWRRAPAWRLCLVSAVVFTGLAAMFPPSIPHLLWQQGPLGVADEPPAHYKSLPTMPPTNKGTIHLPPPDAGRQGMVPVAGRTLPLPTGVWHELALARYAGPDGAQVIVLDRVEANHLTGLIISTAPIAQSPSAGPVGIPPPCVDPERIAGYIVPEPPDASPLTHECWAIIPADMREVATGNRSPEVVQRALTRLGSMNIAVADHMLVVRTMSAGDDGWLLTEILLPADRPGSAKRVQDWAARFFTAIQKGFAHTLTAADLPPSVARDPT